MEKNSIINKNAMVNVFYIGFILTTIGESIMGPIFPPEAEGRGIKESIIGLVMGTHPLFCIASSVWMAKHLHSFGRRRIMLIGNFIQGIGYIILAIIAYLPIQQKTLFVCLATFGRILSGVGSTFFQTPCYSFVTLLFKDTCELKISYLEMFLGMGIVLGSL
jgi:MFS family permease